MSKTPILSTQTLHAGVSEGDAAGAPRHWMLMSYDWAAGAALATAVGLGPVAFQPVACELKTGVFAVPCAPAAAWPGMHIRMPSAGLLSPHLNDSKLLSGVLAAGGWVDDDEMLLEVMPALQKAIGKRLNRPVSLQVDGRNQFQALGTPPPLRSGARSRRPRHGLWI